MVHGTLPSYDIHLYNVYEVSSNYFHLLKSLKKTKKQLILFTVIRL